LRRIDDAGALQSGLCASAAASAINHLPAAARAGVLRRAKSAAATVVLAADVNRSFCE
jgi:hypothetical protein